MTVFGCIYTRKGIKCQCGMSCEDTIGMRNYTFGYEVVMRWYACCFMGKWSIIGAVCIALVL